MNNRACGAVPDNLAEQSIGPLIGTHPQVKTPIAGLTGGCAEDHCVESLRLPTTSRDDIPDNLAEQRIGRLIAAHPQAKPGHGGGLYTRM